MRCRVQSVSAGKDAGWAPGLTWHWAIRQPWNVVSYSSSWLLRVRRRTLDFWQVEVDHCGFPGSPVISVNDAGSDSAADTAQDHRCRVVVVSVGYIPPPGARTQLPSGERVDLRREIHSARRFDRFERRFRCTVYQIVSLPGRPTQVNAGNEVHILRVL